MPKLSSKHDVFTFSTGDAKQRRRVQKEAARMLKEQAKQRESRDKVDDNAGFPRRTWGPGGERRPRSGWGTTELKLEGVKAGAHTAATAYPYVAGPSLGANGVLIGRDMHGGGPFCFDPWDAYNRRLISGMSMLLFGTVGTGKSSLAKSLSIRLVLVGRKLSVASDLKGEWTPIVKTLGGVVIQVGPGIHTRLNPLDEGIRPSKNQQGETMTDQDWKLVVRTRRMTIMETLVKILNGADELSPPEHAALEEGIDGAERIAAERGRTPTIPDVIKALEATIQEAPQRVADAAEMLALTFQRTTSGDLAGMFDGESTVNFSSDSPAVSIDTSSMRGASQVARRMVSACCGAWMESMVTNSDAGQRIIVYEEGWDSLSSRADLQRMVENWKLARAYGIFNILIMHKVSDLNMAGDQGSQMAAMARSLLADADVKVIYRQDSAALKVTMDELELNDREKQLLRSLPKGEGLWRVGQSTFEVYNELTPAELPLLNTDERMDSEPDEADTEDADAPGVEVDADGDPIPAWLHTTPTPEQQSEAQHVS
ncbi:conjugal transfer protein TraC [Nesterenkonia alkaliphila]|uniref:Conjugal transfer protein TraC n=1 Tax=Nesterenkonia alkaliphila TaxID=1463631 RepID=A0A7K1UH32_9MICC|nr:conjugal transfer protein TraC [Nesterenkonia alkaliphila]MVT25722.1 conjugal transfer protein TraC [Nesterenkonia alkaliphila]GFZ85368.1 ATP-binding protein [Nesterenkonia alkaliphila]